MHAETAVLQTAGMLLLQVLQSSLVLLLQLRCC